MSLSTIIVVALISSAFMVFAVALGYGQCVTSNLKQDDAARPASDREGSWKEAA